MTAFVFVNNLDTTLADAASSTATTLTLSSTAQLPTLGADQIMPLTLNDAATGLVYEIVYVTDISGATLTVERAQEGTTAQHWNVGDYAFSGPTADTVAPVVSYARPTVSETLIISNNLVVQPGTLSANITLTLPSAPRIGAVYTIYGSASAYTVTVASSVSSGSPSINTPDGTAIYSYVIPASSPYRGIICVWDGTNWRAQTFGTTVGLPAADSNQFTTLSQVQGLIPDPQVLQPTANTTITPGSYYRTIVLPAFSAAGILTIAAGSTIGQTVVVFGDTYAITVNSSVSSGSPYFTYVDGSTNYSWTIPAGADAASLILEWDGTNWRANTTGNTVGRQAASGNQFVTLGQLNPVQVATSSAHGTNTTVTVTASFTASGPGTLIAFGSRINAGEASTADTATLYINGTQIVGDDTQLTIVHWGYQSTTGGSVNASYTAAIDASFSAYVMLLFLPSV